MRLGNSILFQPIDATGAEEFVIMDESSGNEITLSRTQVIALGDAIRRMVTNYELCLRNTMGSIRA